MIQRWNLHNVGERLDVIVNEGPYKEFEFDHQLFMLVLQYHIAHSLERIAKALEAKERRTKHDTKKKS